MHSAVILSRRVVFDNGDIEAGKRGKEFVGRDRGGVRPRTARQPVVGLAVSRQKR
jgi:hypothetical protein